jgi:hypothetical protein
MYKRYRGLTIRLVFMATRTWSSTLPFAGRTVTSVRTAADNMTARACGTRTIPSMVAPCINVSTCSYIQSDTFLRPTQDSWKPHVYPRESLRVTSRARADPLRAIASHDRVRNCPPTAIIQRSRQVNPNQAHPGPGSMSYSELGSC